MLYIQRYIMNGQPVELVEIGTDDSDTPVLANLDTIRHAVPIYKQARAALAQVPQVYAIIIDNLPIDMVVPNGEYQPDPETGLVEWQPQLDQNGELVGIYPTGRLVYSWLYREALTIQFVLYGQEYEYDISELLHLEANRGQLQPPLK